MDAVLDIKWHLLPDAPFERRERPAGFERVVVCERESSAQARAQLPAVGLRNRAHHLELAPRDAAAGEGLRIEQFKIGAGADENVPGRPGFGRGLELRRV